MKSFLKLFSLIFVLSTLIVSCDDDVTYAEQLRAEKKLIADYIKRNNIKSCHRISGRLGLG